MPTPIPPSTSPQSPVTTNAPSVESAAPAVTPEKPEPQTPKEDPKAAAKNAQASKQQAKEKKSENVMREQLVKKELNAGNWEAVGARFGADAVNAGVGTLRDATGSAAKTSKTEKATSPDKPAQQKKTDKPSEGTVWESVKGAARYTADVANAGVGLLRESVATAAAADASEKAAQVERGKAMVKRGGAALAVEIELVGSGKSNFADVERVIGNLDAYNREATGADIKQFTLNKDESMRRLLGPYGYDKVDYGWTREFPGGGKITQTEVLNTALHNWRNTPLEARKAIHAGDYMNLPDNYKKNWQPVDHFQIHQQNRATEGAQVVKNPPLPGDHGRSYEGPRRNQPDPGLVWAQAKKDFTDASFDVINSLGGELPAKGGRKSSRTGGAEIAPHKTAPPPERIPMPKPDINIGHAKTQQAPAQPAPAKPAKNAPAETAPDGLAGRAPVNTAPDGLAGKPPAKTQPVGSQQAKPPAEGEKKPLPKTGPDLDSGVDHPARVQKRTQEAQQAQLQAERRAAVEARHAEAVKTLPGPKEQISVDQALEGIRNQGWPFVLSMTPEHHAREWLESKHTGEAPLVFRDGDQLRIDYKWMTPDQRARLHPIATRTQE